MVALARRTKNKLATRYVAGGSAATRNMHRAGCPGDGVPPALSMQEAGAIRNADDGLHNVFERGALKPGETL